MLDFLQRGRADFAGIALTKARGDAVVDAVRIDPGHDLALAFVHVLAPNGDVYFFRHGRRLNLETRKPENSDAAESLSHFWLPGFQIIYSLKSRVLRDQ